MNTVVNADKELINKKFNKLTILRKIGGRPTMVECRCDCTKIKIIRKSHVISGAIKTCGCLTGIFVEEGLRLCSTCNNKYSYDQFHKCKRTKLGLTKKCKFCASKYKKEYIINNKEKLKKSKYKYYQTNKFMYVWRSMLTTVLKKTNQNKKNKTEILLGYSYIKLKEHLELLFTDGMNWDNYGYNKKTGEIGWSIDHIKPISAFDKDTPMNEINALSNLRPMWLTSRIINGIFYEGNMNKGNKYEIK